MEQALKSRNFVLREIAAVDFLNDYIPQHEWHLELDANFSALNVDGEGSSDIGFNDVHRALTWTSPSLRSGSVIGGALSFDREFRECHGTVTTADNCSYLVQSIPVDGTPDAGPGFAGQVDLFLENPADDSDDFMPFAKVLDKIQNDLVFENPPPPYHSGDEKQAVLEAVDTTEKTIAADDTDGDAIVEAPQQPVVSQETAPTPKTTNVKLSSYSTNSQLIPDGDWIPYEQFGIGVENSEMGHVIVYLGTKDISNYVVSSKDGDHLHMERNQTGAASQWGFDIEFTGTMLTRAFTGTLISPSGKEYNWQGKDPVTTEVARDGANLKTKGSDGLLLDPLLFTISSMSRDEKAVDLAQKEADVIFGRLVFASVDQDIIDMLYPGKFILTPAEKDIQKLGPEFLKRAGVHSVLQNIKASESVKQKTKNKIKQEKCERFMPMCVSTVAPKTDLQNDPVVLYGFDREKDKDLIYQLQSQAQSVSRACYLHAYRTQISEIQPYLNNAGEWYNMMYHALNSSTFTVNWELRALGSEGFAKKLYELHNKLDVLWQVAHESEQFKSKLEPGIDDPEKIMATLNGVAFNALTGSIAWDDTSRSNFLNFFKKLDEVQKDERKQQLIDMYKKQMIVDGQKNLSFQTMGEYCLQLMEELRKNQKWTAREAQAQLALLHAQQARQAAGGNAPAWYRNIQWKEGFLAYFRSAVTVVAVGGLVSLFHISGATMGWDDQLALWGQISQGLSGAANAVVALAKGGAVSVGNFLNKWFLAPLGNLCRAIGAWIYDALPRLGKGLIEGIGALLNKIKGAISSGAEVVGQYAARFGAWLKSLPVNWSGVFNVLAKFASFAISAICFWVTIRDCIAAFKNGRTLDKVTSTIAAVLVGLEVLCLVIQGIASLVGATAVVGVCSMVGTVLAAAGIVFAVVLIVLAFVYAEDPLDDMVVNHGRPYGIVG